MLVNGQEYATEVQKIMKMDKHTYVVNAEGECVMMSEYVGQHVTHTLKTILCSAKDKPTQYRNKEHRERTAWETGLEVTLIQIQQKTPNTRSNTHPD